MKLAINEDVLSKYNLSLGEFLLLYLSYKGENIKASTDSLIQKELISKDLFSEGNYVLSDNSKELLSSIIIDSDEAVIDKDAEFYNLATKLRELYPKGRKPGTTYMWRGTIIEVAKKLKTLVAKYKCSFTEEQAISATQRYISSFNGDYTKMRLLKYFILKTERDADGNAVLTSDLMSFIENEETESNNDWTTTLV